MDGRLLHVVVGTGALGLAVARALAGRGASVRAVNRSGRAAVPDEVEVVGGDVTDQREARRLCLGAAVVYHCASAPYAEWPEKLPPIMDGVVGGAAAAAARLVYGDNLYMYGEASGPLTEALPDAAAGPNGRVRARLAETLLAAHRDGRVRATIGRGSDFYGPFARDSKAGDLVFGRVLEGKAARVLGDPDAPHTYTFVDDFARALVTLGEREEALGEAWHAPSAPTITAREFVRLVCEEAGRPPKLAAAPKAAISLMALFDPTMRAAKEVLYQSERPWVVDHGKFERAFGAEVTPHREAIAQTLEWYRRRVHFKDGGTI